MPEYRIENYCHKKTEKIIRNIYRTAKKNRWVLLLREEVPDPKISPKAGIGNCSKEIRDAECMDKNGKFVCMRSETTTILKFEEPEEE